VDFTIITPNLNYARFLGDCLESVARQDGVNVEHIVYDGGSTDDSAGVVAGFPAVRWEQREDSGMSEAINRGFDEARGEWVMWLNADDRLKPGALAAMLAALRKSNADVAYGDFDFIDEGGQFIRHVRPPGWSPFVHVHHCCYVGSTAAFYRRSSVLAAGHRLRNDFRYVMDGEFYARLHSTGMSFEKLPVNVADFRLHGANASMRHLKASKDIEEVLRAERQHVESRAIRRVHGVTLFSDPYLTGLVDGILWIAARGWKAILRLVKY